MILPTKLKVFDTFYKVSYYDDMLNVDYRHESKLFGQCVFEDQEIRIYKGQRTEEEILGTIFHEVFHALVEEYHLSSMNTAEDKEVDDLRHNDLDVLARGTVQMLINSGLIKLTDKKNKQITTEEV